MEPTAMLEFNEEFDNRLRPKLEALEQVRGDLNSRGATCGGLPRPALPSLFS